MLLIFDNINIFVFFQLSFKVSVMNNSLVFLQRILN